MARTPTHLDAIRTTKPTKGPKVEAHKWEFKARLRRHAFGWKSQPAIARIKQAVAEIKRPGAPAGRRGEDGDVVAFLLVVAKAEPVLAAEGPSSCSCASPPRSSGSDAQGSLPVDR